MVDVLVLGAGAAGLTAALSLPKGLSVAVLTKDPSGGSTRWAQGGVAAVIDDHDSIESHVEDTLVAGAGLCCRDVVEYVVTNARESIDWLVEQGVAFTRSDANFHLTREGGHSHRRILHAADATGWAIQDALDQQASVSNNIQFHHNFIAIDLCIDQASGPAGKRVNGCYVLNKNTGRVETFLARAVVLATGGASKVYQYTSNPDGASGDGIAMGWRAGCRVANLEFNQFHPTCLFHPDAKSFLISEALRGEGGFLRLPDGTRFMPAFHARAELAPRDVVARAIDHEMKRLGVDSVYLDITHKSSEFIDSHFPTINQRLNELGINMKKDWIPVVPAAHYTCGGILVDLDGGTDLKGLYAIGEVSSTGLHGANRMASNSLLECIVYGRAAANHIAKTISRLDVHDSVRPWDASQVTDSDEDVVISHNWAEIRRFMWDYVGIVRTNKRLQRALNRTQLLEREIQDFYANYRVTANLIELRNIIVVAELIIKSALKRKESRGLHHTLDHPDLSEHPGDTILIPDHEIQP
ncbi:L-aspartate oxidase [Litorivicinus sp.]|nr:L-aspartate oxidase [Litorivicinus sp.]